MKEPGDSQHNMDPTTELEKLQILRMALDMANEGVELRWPMGVVEMGHHRYMYEMTHRWYREQDSITRAALLEDIKAVITENWTTQMLLMVAGSIKTGTLEQDTAEQAKEHLQMSELSMNEFYDLDWDKILDEMDPGWEEED